MITYVPAFLWGLLLFGAFVGWGTLVERLLWARRDADLGELVAWGIAGTTAIGGVLNLFEAISPALLIAIVAVGCPLGLLRIDEARRALTIPKSNGLRFATGLLVLLAVARYAGSVNAVELDKLDDHSAYLVFPYRMLSEGSLGRDPFCVRRMESSLGGGSFLLALELAVFPEQFAKTIDLGVGLLASLAAAWGLLRSRGASPWFQATAAGILLIDRPPANNLTNVVIPIALLIAIARAMAATDDRFRGRLARPILLAILAAGLCGLKSSLIPITFFCFAIRHFAIGRSRRNLEEFGVFALTSLAIVLPWMISMRMSSGTFFYPLLGKGYHGVQYGTLLKPNAEFTPAFLLRNYYLGLTEPVAISYFLLAATALSTTARLRSIRPEDLAFILAPIPSALLVFGMFDQVQSVRYMYSAYIASIILTISCICEQIKSEHVEERRLMLLGLTIASAAFFAGSRWTQARVFYQAAALNVRAGLSDRRYTEPGEIARYRSLQDAIPAGEKVLVRLSKGYLLDYRRNPVYVADWPGGASLPPGLPFFKGSEAVAEYLLSKGIRHVAYSYADQCNLPRRVIEPGLTTWDRTVTEHAFDFQDNLITLMKSRITLYDDGRLVLLDLAKRNPHRTPVP